MATTPTNSCEFLELVTKSGIVREAEITGIADLPSEPTQCAAALIGKGVITKFQAKLLLNGRYKGLKLGAYVIRDQIGQGGMGTVYLAEHETLKRRVALKVLTLAKDGNNALSVERFLREARSAAALDHPNIVRLHDVGKSGDTHYLVMEFVEGQTLDQIIGRGGTLSTSRAVEYVAQAAAGLQHATERGFVHRDIKPANLMLAKDGTIKILDMGLARPTSQDADKLTEVMDKGAIVGTADFISPEQAMNAPLDVRSDIYSLGATFFSLVTGQPPFSGNTTQKLIQHQMKAAPSVTTLDRTFPAGLSAVVAKMLAKKPEQRYQSPADVIKALAEWLPQHAGARLQAALTNTDLGRSEEMQATLSEVTNGSTKRLASKERLARVVAKAKAKKWFWPAVAVGVFVLAGVVGAVVSLSGGAPEQETPLAIVPAKPGPGNPESVSVKVPDPVAAKELPRAVVFQHNFSKQKPFVERGHNTVAGTGTRKWAVDAKEGDGAMPAGWLMTTSKPGTIAETAVKMVDDQPVIGYRCPEGSNSFWLKTPTFTTRTGKFIVSLEYSTDAADTLPIFKITQETPLRKILHDARNLPASGAGTWRPFSKEIDIAAGSAGWVEFHATGGARDYIWIRNFTILQGGNPAETPSRDVPLYSVNFRTLAVGADRFENTNRSFDVFSIGGRDLLSSMFIHSHKIKITSEYRIADFDGVRALGMQQFVGMAGTQVHFTLNETYSVLKPDETVNIRIVYRFDGTGNGAACMERRSDRRIKNGRWLLTPTDGQWRTLEFPFIRPAHDDPYELIVNAGNGEMEPRAEGVIWIKSIEVKYADAK